MVFLPWYLFFDGDVDCVSLGFVFGLGLGAFAKVMDDWLNFNIGLMWTVKYF